MKLPYLIAAGFPGADQVRAWAKRIVDDLNRERSLSELPTFADDVAALAAGMKSKDGYVTPAGVVRRVL